MTTAATTAGWTIPYRPPVIRAVHIQLDHVHDLGDQFGLGGEPEPLGQPELDPV
jgi:hypothetical protein